MFTCLGYYCLYKYIDDLETSLFICKPRDLLRMTSNSPYDILTDLTEFIS